MHRLVPLLLLTVPLIASGANPQTVVLDVQNMTCELCPITVKQALGKVAGVTETKVDLEKMTATVRFDADKANVAALVHATTNAGFPSSVHR